MAESTTRTPVRGIPEAVWDWDIIPGTVWWGEGFSTLFGYATSQIEPGIESWTLRIHPDDRERVLTRLFRVLDSGGKTWSDDYRFRRADGSHALVFDRGYVLRGPDGRAVRMLGSMQDVTERERAESELRGHRERLWSLSQRLLEVQETERRHIARELHDEVGQLLTAAKLTLQATQRARSAATARGLIREGLSLLDQCIEQVRSLSLELRPSLLDDLGLVPALRWYLERQGDRAGFQVKLLERLGNARLPPEVETAIFRVAQEALTNVARHARAERVQVSVATVEGELALIVSDNGIGFDVPAARARAVAGESLGLLGMEERVTLVGGRIWVDSAPGRGTELHVRLPLPAPDAPASASGAA